MRIGVQFTLIGLTLTLGAKGAFAQPETMGPLPVSTWNAGTLNLVGASLPTTVYYSTTPTATSPLVVIMHGFQLTGAYYAVLGQTLASRGLVAVVPSMPCSLVTCDHNANARQLIALADWAVSESSRSGSPLYGRVDGSRRGLIGHSWGGLGAFLASSMDPRFQSLAMFDPNDDRSIGAMAAPGIPAPSILIKAEQPSNCNATKWTTSVYPTTRPPRARVNVVHSGHCDPENPPDPICPTFCSAGDRSTSPYFQRYAVAWTTCILLRDSSMAPYVNGAGLQADTMAGIVNEVDQVNVAALPCLETAMIDGGITAADTGAGDDVSSSDASAAIDAELEEAGEDGAAPPMSIDAASPAPMSQADSGPSPGTNPPASKPGSSCRCTASNDAAADPTSAPVAWLFIAGVGSLIRIRMNRDRRRSDPFDPRRPRRDDPPRAPRGSGGDARPHHRGAARRDEDA
jgi:hypothetical protein